MVTLKNGFFFFFLSKLFAVNCSTTNPTSPINYGRPVNDGMFNSWMTNNYNTYSSNSQGLQTNGVYPNDHRQNNYKQQLTIPNKPQSYNFQEQQNLRNPSQIAQTNPVMKDHLKKQQSTQSNLNNANVHNQPTITQYPNQNHVNTNYYQPNYQNTLPTKSQVQNVQSLSHQFSTPLKIGKETPQSASMTISSSPNEYLNQFSSKSNQHQPQLPISSHSSQFKTSEMKSKPNSQYPQNNLSSNQPKPTSLPLYSSTQKFTDKAIPDTQNTPQSPHPSKSSPPLQLNPKPYLQHLKNNPSSNQPKPPSLPFSSSSQKFTDEAIPDIQNKPQLPEPPKSFSPLALKTSEVKSEPYIKLSQNYPSSNQPKPPSLPFSSSSQKFTDEAIPDIQNKPQLPEPPKSFSPLQLKTSEVKSEPYIKLLQNYPSSNQPKPPSLPFSSSSQKFTDEAIPDIQNKPQLPEPPKSFSPLQLKTSEVKSEPYIKLSQKYPSSNQPKPPSLPFSSSSQKFTDEALPDIQNKPQLPEPPKSFSPLQLKTSEVKSEPYIKLLQNYPFSNQPKPPSLPFSSSSQKFTDEAIPDIPNTPQLPEPPKSSSPLELKTSEVKSEPYITFSQNNPSSNQPKPPSLPFSSSSQKFTDEAIPDIQNKPQLPEPPKSSSPLELKTSEVKSEPYIKLSQNYPSSNPSKLTSLPLSSSSQKFIDEAIPDIQNKPQLPEPPKSSSPLELKTSEVKSEPYIKLSQNYPSSNPSKLTSLPLSSSSQKFIDEAIPDIQNKPQLPEPPKSSSPLELKTSEVKSEPYIKLSQNYPSSNPSKLTSLPLSSSSQKFIDEAIPDIQNKPQLPEPPKSSSPLELKTSEVKSEPYITFSQNNPSSNPSKLPSLPVSSSLESSELNPLSNPKSSSHPLHFIPTIQSKTPQTRLDSKTSSFFAPQFSQSNFSSDQSKWPIMKNPFQAGLRTPTKSSPSLLTISDLQLESKTPSLTNTQSSEDNSSPYHHFSSQKSPFQSILTGENLHQPTKNLTIQSNSLQAVTAPITTNINNLEPLNTLPQSSLVDLSRNSIQDQDITVPNSQSNLPDKSSVDNILPFPTSNHLNDDSLLNDNKNANHDTLESKNEPIDFEDKKSDLESKLKNGASRIPIKLSETSTNLHDTDNAIDSLNILKSDEPEVLTDLAMFDRPSNIGIENPENTEEEIAKFRVFADPSDIYIINIDSTQSSPSITDKGELNNNNLLNTQPTRTPWSVLQRPNNAGVQQSNFNSDKLLNSLFNSNKDEMLYNQMPTDMPNNNYDSKLNTYDNNYPYHTFSNKPQDISKNTNQPSSKEESGYIYKQVDLINPSSSVNSWSLPKKDYSIYKRPDKNNDYSRNNGISQTNVLKTSPTYNQNSNQHISIPYFDNNSVQSMISIISKAVGAPLDATKAIFGLTQASFPNAEVIQQLNLTYSVVQSVILSLRKILNTVVNHLFGQRVKRDYNMLGPMSNILSKTSTKPALNFPPIASLKKKEYQSTSETNTDSYNNQPKNTPFTMIMNTNRQPTTKTGISLNQPYSQNLFSSRSYVDTKKQMYNSEINEANIDYNKYKQLDSTRTTQQAPNTRGYVSDMLTNEIRTQIYTNLPDSYTRNSPEVEEYCQQVMIAVEIFFRNQINNVLQGHSPNMDMI